MLAYELKRLFEELVVSAEFAEVNKTEFHAVNKRSYRILLVTHHRFLDEVMQVGFELKPHYSLAMLHKSASAFTNFIN